MSRNSFETMNIFPERFNAATVFIDSHVNEGRAKRPAIFCGERVVSYGDLHENVNRFGNVLLDRDIRMEERVAILLPDIPEFAFAFFGTMKTGAVAVPLNTLLGPNEYEYMLGDSRARLLVVHAALLAPLLPILGRLEHLKHVVVCGGDIGGYPRLEALLQNALPTLDTADTSRDDTAFWLYSSGTTGFPKGTVHLHHDMVVAADRYAIQTLGIEGSDLSFSVAKLFFAYGLGNGLYFPLRVGGTSVLLPDKPMPDAVFGVVDRYQPTIFYSVPTSYAALLQTAEREGRTSLGRVRMCVSAGEPLPKPLFDRWLARFGVEILGGIGSTEALHIFISNRPGEARGGSTGRMVPGYDARIVDDNGTELPPGEVGTLLIRGDSIASGYWNKHEQTKKTILGEWCDTRDKFRVDEEGFYTYAGRSDDMMKVGGQWVSPTELESVLQQHPAVLESGVVGIVDAQGLTNPAAYIVLKEGLAASPELALELQVFVRENTAPHHYSCWIEFIDDLPKTATGKIQRFKLRRMSGKQPMASQQGQTPSQPIMRGNVDLDEKSQREDLPAISRSELGVQADSIPITTRPMTDVVARLERLTTTEERWDHLSAYVRSQLAMVLGVDDPSSIDTESGFFDLGMDSTAAVAFTNRLEVGLGHSLPATLLFKYSSPNTLVDYIVDEVLAQNADRGAAFEVGQAADTSQSSSQGASREALNKVKRLSDQELEALIDRKLQR
uniref:Benzoate-CoA ligase n=1 Tax=Candidatus Kentrum sp. LFY TaxID=2126342 RepID=A0A450UUK2_9GAMM|nr:MAG: benzoate-CoA ligase [Candidatus Kentron sp. LFY]